MNISRSQLYRIIIEEYAKEEGLQEALSPEKVAELLAWIKGEGPRPEWATDDYGSSGLGKAVQSSTDSSVDRAADTMPFPADSAPEPEPAGSIEDQIASLVQGMDPEAVSDLFQSVFAKIPGIEMGPAEEEPETLYSPGAEGRPQVGFKLEELMNLIREVLAENV